jgi:hypothetical protein
LTAVRCRRPTTQAIDIIANALRDTQLMLLATNTALLGKVLGQASPN